MARPPRIPCLLPLGQPVVYFVTLCIQNRAPVLANRVALDAVESFLRGETRWTMLALVLMPDHLHALVAPLNDREQPVTQFSAGLKRHLRRAMSGTWRWQEGVFDRLLRREETAQGKWLYMRENPVRAGLVARWEDWPHMIGFRG
jgi:REP element-mobilizing transposase RayT